MDRTAFKITMKRTLLVATGTLIFGCGRVLAGETGQSFYLLGSNGSMAGMTPPPGTYVADLNYYYAGSASGNAALGTTLQRTGARDSSGASLTVDANLKVRGEAYYNIPTALWVAPGQVLGGNFGVSIATPLGWKSVNANIDAVTTFTIPPLGQTLRTPSTISES